MKHAFAILALGVLAGCAPEPTISMQMEAPQHPIYSANARFEVQRVAVFSDDLAYNDRRGIYIIKDTVTGTEYVGVSGIGISEVGRHINGKVTVQDER